MAKVPARVKKRDPARVDAAQALREIKPVQRLAIEALLHSATRPLALEKLRAQEVDVSLKTLNKWCSSPRFIRAWKARETQIAARITKDSVIVNAQNLLEEAMEGTPIVSHDKKTGEAEIIGYKKELGHALTANEQLGKATGAFQADQGSKIAVIVDIDFSGRKDPVREIHVEAIDAEYTAVDSPQPPELAEWLR